MSSCDSDPEYFSDVDEDECGVEAIQVWRHAKTSQKNQNKRKSGDSAELQELLEHRMQPLEAKLQACKNSQDSEVLADLGAWLASSGAPERVLNTEKGIASALLRPSVMNAKHAGCTLAHRIYEQIAPDGEVPIACTLQDVVELCHTKNDGDLTGSPDLLVLLPDAEKVQVEALQLLVRALSAAQTANPGFVPALVLGLATHPTLVHPHLDPRILGRLRPAEFRMPRHIDSLGRYMIHMQHSLEIPEVVLGPRICSYLAESVKLYDHRCDLVSQALRFSAMSHHLASSKGQLIPALKTGDRTEIRAALKRFQEDEPQTHDMLETEAQVAGLEPAPEPKVTRKSNKSSRKQSGRKKSEVLLTALMGLHQSIMDWQLCLHWVHIAAKASSQELDWWHIATAAASRTFVQNPGAVCIDRVPDSGPNKSRRLDPAGAGSSRMGEAYFSDDETGKKITTVLSEVSKLSDEQVKDLISELVAKTDSCEHGRSGSLKEPLARLEKLMKDAAKAEKLSCAASDEEQGSDEETHHIQPPNLAKADDDMLEAEPLRMAGAGGWSSSDGEDLEQQHAPALGRVGCAGTSPVAVLNHDPHVAVQAEAEHCCREGSPLRIAGGGGGWPSGFHNDDNSSAEIDPCQQALERKCTRSSLQRVIEAQQIASQAHTGAAAFTGTRGSRTGAKAGVGPSSGDRSPFQTRAAGPVSPAAMQQQNSSVGAAIHQKKKNLPKFQAAMRDKCFSASGTCETSQTAVGTSAALPPLPGRSPHRQLKSSTAGDSDSNPQAVADAQPRSSSERQVLASCGTHVDVKTASPSTKVSGATGSVAMAQPGRKRRRSNRLAGGPPGCHLEPVPEDSVALCPEVAYAEASAMASRVTPKKEGKGSPLKNVSTPSMERKDGAQGNGTPQPRNTPQEFRTPCSGPMKKGSPGSLKSTPASARRTPGQSMGKFLLQQTQTPGQAGADENDQGLQNRAVVNVDSLAYKVSRVLREAWLHVLQTHPSTLPCASVLCYDDAYALRRALHPSATADLHAVLSNPSQYLDATQKGNGCKVEASSGRQLPTTCLAYQLLRGYGESVDVGDWFASFCLALGVKSSYDGKPTRKRAGKTPAKKRKKMKTVERTADQAGTSSQLPTEDQEDVEEPKLKSAVDIDAAADDLPELTAKFCHAVAELEVMGYLQRGKRKGAVRLQRTLFPPPVFHS